MEGTICWSDLPQCLLELILKRLSMPDRLLCGSVCRSWFAAKKQCHVLPFNIFYSLATKGNIVEIFSVPDERRYKMLVRELHSGYVCVSSSHGWILFQPENNFYKSLLVKNEERIFLPRKEIYLRNLDCLYYSTPFDPDGVIFVRRSNNTFLLYRCCERQFYRHQWRETVMSNTIFFEGKLYTVSFNKGKKRKMHMLSNEDWGLQDEDWNLAVIDPLFPADSATLKMRMKQGHNSQLLPTLEDHVFVLVESCGEILIVRLMGNGGRNLNCDVFQADLNKMEWMKVENLGDRILLLSHGSSISVSAREMSCKGNCIYYIPSCSDTFNGVCKGFKTMNMTYVEFELGSDQMIIHSIPDLPIGVFGRAWFTP